MIFRTYTFVDLPEVDWANDIKNTLAYSTDGVVNGYELNDDYMTKNNSTCKVTAETTAEVGQIIALIDDSGAFACGVITTVDNEKLELKFRSLLALFDDTVLNPRMVTSEQQFVLKYQYDGINDTATMLLNFFGGINNDKWRRLPLLIKTSGGGTNSGGSYNVPAIWDYGEDISFNCLDYIIKIFNNNNIVVQPRLVFEVSRAYIELTIHKNDTSGELIKNNITGIAIEQQEQAKPTATVCMVIDKDSKKLLSTWFLLTDNTVSSNIGALNRVQPYILTVQELDSNDTSTPKPTAQTVAEQALLYKDFNHYISISIDRSNAMYPNNLSIGDSVDIVPKMLEVTQDTPLLSEQDKSKYIIPSIYTGRVESDSSTVVTLIFGKFRVDYRDFIQQNYSKVRQ